MLQTVVSEQDVVDGFVHPLHTNFSTQVKLQWYRAQLPSCPHCTRSPHAIVPRWRRTCSSTLLAVSLGSAYVIVRLRSEEHPYDAHKCFCFK